MFLSFVAPRIIAVNEERSIVLRSAMMRAVAFLFAVTGTVGQVANAASVAGAEMEPEMRCCLAGDEAKNAFWIILVNIERPVVHFRLRTPAGMLAGFDPQSKMFYPPMAEAVYAGYFETTLLDAPEFHLERNFFRNPTMIVRQLHEGEYRVEVIGIRSGKYHLSFNPLGDGDTRGSIGVGRYPDGIAITRGEIHTYTFNGKFDDPRDGRINPDTSPTYFRVKRVK